MEGERGIELSNTPFREVVRQIDALRSASKPNVEGLSAVDAIRVASLAEGARTQLTSYEAEVKRRTNELCADKDFADQLRQEFRSQIERAYRIGADLTQSDVQREIESGVTEMYPAIKFDRYSGIFEATVAGIGQEINLRNARRRSNITESELSEARQSQYFDHGIDMDKLMHREEIVVPATKIRASENDKRVSVGGARSSEIGVMRYKDTEYEGDLPESIDELTKIIRNRKEDPQKRKAAGRLISNMFQYGAGAELGLDADWLSDFTLAANKVVKDANGDWEKVSNGFKYLIARYEGGTAEDSKGREKTFEGSLSDIYKDNPKYKGLVGAVLGGYQRYADWEVKIDTAIDSGMPALEKKLIEEQRDIADFEFVVPVVNINRRSRPQAQQHAQGPNVNTDPNTGPNASTKEDEKLPMTPEKQRAFLMKKLRVIEAWDSPLVAIYGHTQPPKNGEALSELMGHLRDPNCEQELCKEVLARLRLHHCYQIVINAERKGGQAGEFFKVAFSNVDSASYALDQPADPEEQFYSIDARKSDTEKIFEIPGVSDALGVIQKADAEGYLFKGTVIRLNQKIYNDQRLFIEKEMMRELVSLGHSEATATEALTIARRYDKATFEDCVRNYDFKRPGIISKLMFFNRWRLDPSNDDEGPKSTISNIEAFDLSSYLRMARTKVTSRVNDKDIQGYAFLPSIEDNPEYLATIHGITPLSIDRSFIDRRVKEKGEVTQQNCPEMRRAFFRRNWGIDLETREKMYIKPSETQFGSIERGQYVKYVSTTLPKCLEVASDKLLLNSAISPQDATSNAMSMWKDRLKVADRTGFCSLQFWMVFGIVDYATQRPDIWKPSDWKQFISDVVTYGVVSQEQLSAITALNDSMFVAQMLEGAKQGSKRWNIG